MLKRIGAIGLAALLVVILSGVPFVSAEPAVVTCSVGSYFTLALSPLPVNFGPVEPDVDNFSSITATVRNNTTTTWTLSANGSDNFTGASYTMPISRLQHMGGDIGAYTDMTTSPVTVGTGVREKKEIPFDYKLRVLYDDQPDSYQATITYTLVAL